MPQDTAKKQAILDAALSLIAEHGFHGAAVSKIAKQAKVSAGVIYHHFDSKDAIIHALYLSIKHAMADCLLVKLESETTLAEQCHAMFEAAFRFNLSHPDEARFLAQYVTSPYYHPEKDSDYTQRMQPVMDCFSQATEQGIIKDLPDAVCSTLIVDVASSLAQKQPPGPD